MHQDTVVWDFFRLAERWGLIGADAFGPYPESAQGERFEETVYRVEDSVHNAEYVTVLDVTGSRDLQAAIVFDGRLLAVPTAGFSRRN